MEKGQVWFPGVVAKPVHLEVHTTAGAQSTPENRSEAERTEAGKDELVKALQRSVELTSLMSKAGVPRDGTTLIALAVLFVVNSLDMGRSDESLKELLSELVDTLAKMMRQGQIL